MRLCGPRQGAVSQGAARLPSLCTKLASAWLLTRGWTEVLGLLLSGIAQSWLMGGHFITHISPGNSRGA